MKGAALAIEWGWQGGAVRRSMVVFVASFMLGAWISLLMYGSPPEWLGTEAFTWVAGGIAGGADRRRSGGKKLLRRLTFGAARAQTSVEGCRLLVKRTMPRESYRSPDEPNGIARTSKFAESTFQRPSGNSGFALLGGPTGLRNKAKRHHPDCLALLKTRDPTRTATFQTVSSRSTLAIC